MAETVARLHIQREPDFMYYVKNRNVWKVRRKMPGRAKGKPSKVASGDFKMDSSRFLYYIDRKGNVTRAAQRGGKRGVGGGK